MPRIHSLYSRFAHLSLSVFLLLVIALPTIAQAQKAPFSWENAVIYFALTDRFNNGNPDNDHSYGRGYDKQGAEYPFDERGHFHGGDFAGITEKINEGYFTDLGVSALWISPPFEQVHGWIGVDNGQTQMYAYHGYWIMDYTELDANFGTRDGFKAMIDAAHSHDLRVVLDVVINHAGVHSMADMDEFDFGSVDSLWQSWRPQQGENWESYRDQFISYGEASDSTGWDRWWGPSWVRSDLPGYPSCGNDDRTQCLFGLPDFRTDSAEEVDLPPLLLNKWSADKTALERKELNKFFGRTKYPRTPRYYLIKWLSDWVREYGIDGFRLDTAKHVEPETWEALIDESHLALKEYRKSHGIEDDLPFWTVGEIFGHTAGQSTEYDETGIDAFINFEIPYRDLTDTSVLDSLYAAYADHVVDIDRPIPMSYLSSHDTAHPDGSMLRAQLAGFYMLPGPLQILYGDETGRTAVSSGTSMSDLRSFMNWDTIDADLLSQWQLLGSFRSRHPAIGGGEHQRIQDAPYAFSRQLSFGPYHDSVVVVFGAEGKTGINVSKSFPEDAVVQDAMTGRTAIVSFGIVRLQADDSGVMLLELVD